MADDDDDFPTAKESYATLSNKAKQVIAYMKESIRQATAVESKGYKVEHNNKDSHLWDEDNDGDYGSSKNFYNISWDDNKK